MGTDCTVQEFISTSLLSQETMSQVDPDEDIQILTALGTSLIAAIFDLQPLQNIKALMEAGAPLWYQDDNEGLSPLHAAAFVENPDLVKYLFEQGAVWNAVDHLQNTAGDVALSLNNEECCTIICDAGLRSGATQLLLTLLASRATSEPPSSLVLSNKDNSATGSTDTFLSSRLRFTKDSYGQEICMLQTEDDEVGVMMGREHGITISSAGNGHEIMR